MSDEVVKAKLPTLAEIVAAEGLTDREQSNALHVLLNQSPPPSWIKVQDGVKHLPVDKVKFLLTKIFVDWREEIKDVKTIANSVVVVVTLHFRNPITGRWSKMDGIGAAPINTKKGAGSLDWNQIVHDSVHKCAGAADSFALKNAAKKLGRIFGSELTVDDKISYDGLIDVDKFKDAKLTEK